MADLKELLESDVPIETNNHHDQRGISSVLEIARGVCEGGCEEGQIILRGTGQVIDVTKHVRDDPSTSGSLLDENVDAGTQNEDSVTDTYTRSFSSFSIALLLAGLMILAFLAVFFYSQQSRLAKKKALEERPTASLQPDLVDSGLSNNNKNEAISMQPDVVHSGQVPFQPPSPTTHQSAMEVTCSTSSALSASLNARSETDLRQYGAQVANNMQVVMSEFEATMKTHGYNLSRSEALSVVSQQLVSLENNRLAKEQEARQYMYDSQQRTVDRSMAERRHSEAILSSDQDKEWLQKLQRARDSCIASILPSIQTSFAAVGVCWLCLLFYVFVYRESISVTTVVQSIVEMMNQHVQLWNQQTSLSPDSSLVVVWILNPMASVLSGIWGVLLVPLCFAFLYLVVNLLLPTVIVEFLKSIAILWLLVSLLSTIVPCKTLCLVQFTFWAVAQIGVRAFYYRALSALQKLDPCPTNKELVPYISLFDSITNSMVFVSFLLNGFVFVFSNEMELLSLRAT